MSLSKIWTNIEYILPWLPAYLHQQCARRLPEFRPLHLVMGVADHFEPMSAASSWAPPPDRCEQVRRLNRWCCEYPAAVSAWRDEEGHPFRHTYFYPAEEFDEALVDRLALHCHQGWGEIEIHLHHGVSVPDTPENTRTTLVAFRDALADRGCLSYESGSSVPRYGFVHGNWALANSDRGQFCGVDSEMEILAETGCYADFTLPAPSSAQIEKINALYECALPLNQRAPHRRGNDLRADRTPHTFPLIVQGPLLLDLSRRKHGWRVPGIENGELSGSNPPTIRRMKLWQNAAIGVQGRPDWLFVKLHCHGMAAQDEHAMFGYSMQQFLRELVEGPGNHNDYCLHFVTMREMVNIILAACDRREGSPGEYRNYRFQLLQSPMVAHLGHTVAS